MGLSRGRVSGGLLGLAISVGAAGSRSATSRCTRSAGAARGALLVPRAGVRRARRGRRVPRRALAGDVPDRRAAGVHGDVLGARARHSSRTTSCRRGSVRSRAWPRSLARRGCDARRCSRRSWSSACSTSRRSRLIAAVTLPLVPAGSLRRNLWIASAVIFVVIAVMLLGVASAAASARSCDRLLHRLPRDRRRARRSARVASLRAGIDSLRDRRVARDRDGLVARELDRARASRTTSCCPMFDTGAPWHAAVLCPARHEPRDGRAVVGRRRSASSRSPRRRRSTAYGVPGALALSFALVLHAVNIVPTLAARRGRARAGGFVRPRARASGPGGRDRCAMIRDRAADQCAPHLRGPARRHGRGVPGGTRARRVAAASPSPAT